MKSSRQPIIFVLDSNPVYQRVIAHYLQVAEVGSVITFSDPDKMRQSLKLKPDILIAEYIFDSKSRLGGQVLSEVKQKSPETDIYFHTSLRDVDIAVHAIQSGAVDYIIKSSSALDDLVRKIIKRLQYRKSIGKSRKTFRTLAGYLGLMILVTAGMILYYSLS
jgi:DNA-binding NtrC family response regulator